MNNFPLVTIIIPTFNRAKWLERAINSAIAQTYPNKEIIVVDDGSVDSTEKVVSAFPRVTFLRKSNGGQASARNAGLKYANGKYIASLDSDDEWEKNFLSECIHMLEEKQLSFVFANWNQQCKNDTFRNYFSSCTLLESYIHRNEDSWYFLEYEDLREVYTRGCPSPSSSLVIQASLLKNGWNEEMVIGDDWCMLLDVILNHKVTASFTTKLLWTKHINCNNLVDGRDTLEVYKLLWVEDVQRLIKRYKNQLTIDELKGLEKKYIKSLLMSAKLNIDRNFRYRESIRFFKKQ